MTRPNAGELQALQLAAHGYTSRQIGRHLGVTERAAEQRLWRGGQKLGAQCRAHAVALAIGAGYIRAPQPATTGATP